MKLIKTKDIEEYNKKVEQFILYSLSLCLVVNELGNLEVCKNDPAPKLKELIKCFNLMYEASVIQDNDVVVNKESEKEMTGLNNEGVSDNNVFLVALKESGLTEDEYAEKFSPCFYYNAKTIPIRKLISNVDESITLQKYLNSDGVLNGWHELFQNSEDKHFKIAVWDLINAIETTLYHPNGDLHHGYISGLYPHGYELIEEESKTHNGISRYLKCKNFKILIE